MKAYWPLASVNVVAWTLLVDAPQLQACLAAWEQPTSSRAGDPQRRFEVIWSPEPEVVRAAATIAAELIATLAPKVAAKLPESVLEPVGPSAPELRRAASLAHRMVSYIGGQLDGGTATERYPEVFAKTCG